MVMAKENEWLVCWINKVALAWRGEVRFWAVRVIKPVESLFHNQGNMWVGEASHCSDGMVYTMQFLEPLLTLLHWPSHNSTQVKVDLSNYFWRNSRRLTKGDMVHELSFLLKEQSPPTKDDGTITQAQIDATDRFSYQTGFTCGIYCYKPNWSRSKDLPGNFNLFQRFIQLILVCIWALPKK